MSLGFTLTMKSFLLDSRDNRDNRDGRDSRDSKGPRDDRSGSRGPPNSRNARPLSRGPSKNEKIDTRTPEEKER